MSSCLQGGPQAGAGFGVHPFILQPYPCGVDPAVAFTEGGPPSACGLFVSQPPAACSVVPNKALTASAAFCPPSSFGRCIVSHYFLIILYILFPLKTRTSTGKMF